MRPTLFMGLKDEKFPVLSLLTGKLTRAADRQRRDLDILRFAPRHGAQVRQPIGNGAKYCPSSGRLARHTLFGDKCGGWLAVGEGFEPPEPLLAQQFSRLPLSTTQPPHHRLRPLSVAGPAIGVAGIANAVNRGIDLTFLQGRDDGGGNLFECRPLIGPRRIVEPNLRDAEVDDLLGPVDEGLWRFEIGDGAATGP